MTSFKVLTECPIIVVLLFQQYRRVLQLNCDDFITLTIEMLTLQAKPQIKAQADAERKGQRFSGISPDIKNKQLFCDFIGAQVKVDLSMRIDWGRRCPSSPICFEAIPT
jgi:transformation/transcription domain-associated protein